MRRYFAEFNRVVGDNIRIAERSLNRKGMYAVVVPHKTTLVIERPSSMTWNQFKAAILAELQPRCGSVLISSEHSGRAWVCQNRGNRPGYFQRL
jgi:hypothetical protein